MGNVSVVTVPGAAHFMISTHAREVAREIGEHMARMEGGKVSSYLAVQSIAK